MRTLIRHLHEHMDFRSCDWEVAALPKVPRVSRRDLLEMVRTWHRYFFGTFDKYLQPGGSDLTTKRVLCGFNVVNDEIHYLASEEDLQKLVDAWQARVQSGEAPPSLPGFTRRLLELLGVAAQDRDAEGKESVGDPGLLDELGAGARAAGLHGKRLLGGAAGNMAYLLGHLGVNTLIHCPYHTDGIDWSELNSSVKYLAIAPSEDTLRDAREPAANLPHKTTVGLQLCPSWQHAGLRIDVRESGRVLFMGKEVRCAKGDHTWSHVTIESNGQKADWVWANQAPDVWPHPQVFCGIGSIESDLVIYAPDFGEIIEREAGHPINVAILGGLGVSQKPLDVLDKIRQRQLTGLRKANVAVHTEMSDRFDIEHLAELVRATQSAKTDSSPSSGWSVGLNADDALKLSAKASWEEDIAGAFPESKYLQRLDRGARLLDTLSVDWVYIHGTEIDMAIWRCDIKDELGQQLRDAMLFAKAAVIGGMIRRTVPPYLWPMMRHHLEDSSLASQGFHALAQFTGELEAPASRRFWNASAGVGKRLRQDGYADCGRPKGCDCDVGLSVAPVYWPTDVAPFLSATGAGDFTSAVVAAYVW